MLSDADLKNIEKLARLKLEGHSRDKFRIQLSRIIEFVEILREIDTSDRAAVEGGGAEESFLREDEPAPGLSVEDALSAAPQHEKDQFKIPPVIES